MRRVLMCPRIPGLWMAAFFTDYDYTHLWKSVDSMHSHVLCKAISAIETSRAMSNPRSLERGL